MKKIEDIFSKTQTISTTIPCPNPKNPIIIDKREHQSLVTANLVEQKANISHEILEIGDYLINETIIERKTYSDFLSSITDKRLFTQLKEMKKYPQPILILENFNFSYISNIHQNAIRGTILSIITNYKIPIIYTKDSQDTSKFLIQIAKRQEKNPQEFAIRETKSKLSIKQQKQFILEGFPGIGPTTAKTLLQKFDSLKNIFNAKEEQLKKILSKDKLQKFKNLLEN
jgi:Fanconi anemia group M protein